MNRIVLIAALLISIPMLTLAQEEQDINKYNERKSTQLIEAVMFLDINKTNYLIKAGADLNLKDNSGKTALHYAAMGSCYAPIPDLRPLGRYEASIKAGALLVKILLDAGANVNVLDIYDYSPLSYGVQVDTPEITKLLLDADADVNLKGAKSALLIASFNGLEENARLLLDKGADINASDVNDNKVLIEAAKHQFSLDFIKALHAKGADLNQKDKFGNTALSYYIKYPKGTPEMLQYFISNGADQNALDDQGNTLIANTFYEGVNQPVLDILLKAKPDLNIKNRSGENILGVLASRNSVMDSALSCNLIKQFIAAGADVNSVDNNGRTPLMELVPHDRLSPILALINAGTDMNKKDNEGNTALNYSISTIKRDASPEIVMALLQKTDSIKSNSDFPPFIWACSKGQTEIVRLFIKKKVNVNMRFGDSNSDFSSPLLFASSYGHAEVVKVLIQAKANINILSKAHLITPLMFAASKGNTDVVKILLAAKANTTLKSRSGYTALDFAVEAGKEDIVKLLLPAVPNPILLGNLLLIATSRNSISIVKLLIDSKANVNAKRSDGYTPLFMSINSNNTEYVKMLIAAKANVNYKTPQGETPLSLAKENGNQEIIDMLVKAGAK